MAIQVGLAAPAAAQVPLSGATLQRLVAGKTVVLDTPAGSLPISYRASGTMSARSKGMAILAGRESDTGRWWVAGNLVCQQWSTWLSGAKYCFKVRLDGRTVHWHGHDGKSGTAVIVSR